MYRVLLVDDEVLVREAISENIRWGELGFTLAGSCQNGKEAMEFLEKNSVDVVLTDICMPYVDGMELSEFVFNHFPKTNIIIFSGFDDFEYAKKAIKFNVEEYLLKPVTAFELSEVLTGLKDKMDKKREEENKFGRLNETYYRNKLIIESKALEDLIKGSKTEEENEKALRELNISLDAFAYRVAIIDIDLRSDVDSTEEEMKHNSALMAFSVYNICDEILNGQQAGLACLGGDNHVFILFQSRKPGRFEPESNDLCTEISHMVKKYMKLMITIGIGSSVKNRKDIHISYEEARDSMRYRYLLEDNSILDMENIVRTRNAIKNQRNDLELEDKIDPFILAMKMNDKLKIESILQQIKEAMKEALEDRTESDLYLQQILLAVNNLLKSSNLEESDIYRQKDQLMKDMANSKTLAETIELFQNYCYQVTEEMEMQKNIGGKKQAVLAMDYIKKNYSDSELNLNSVCTYLSISASRFSTIFKNITGETFMEALTNIRMQKAKELLENTDYKNYEIAEKVGFSDPHYFSIAFKKMTGKAPSEYAKEKRRVR